MFIKEISQWLQERVKRSKIPALRIKKIEESSIPRLWSDTILNVRILCHTK